METIVIIVYCALAYIYVIVSMHTNKCWNNAAAFLSPIVVIWMLIIWIVDNINYFQQKNQFYRQIVKAYNDENIDLMNQLYYDLDDHDKFDQWFLKHYKKKDLLIFRKKLSTYGNQ